MSSYTPVNTRTRDTNTIASDVEYALQVANTYLEQARCFNLSLEQSHILEIGPGINFGPSLILASYGAKVTVADRFLTPWSEEYHPVFYDRLRSMWSGPASALDLVIEANRHDEGVIALVPEPAEALSTINTGSIDCVLSNAVLEHVFDLPAVCGELARVTKVGGVNSHQIDFRDHNDFSRPLEFLLLREKDFRREFERKCGEHGNRWRPNEAEALFQWSGFALMRFTPTCWADQPYIHEFVGQLRTSDSPYKHWPAEDLRVVSGRLELRRTDSLFSRYHGGARLFGGATRKLIAEMGRKVRTVSVKKMLVPPRRYALGTCDHDAGHCWIAQIPDSVPSATEALSKLQLLEDHRPLGPPHCPHDEIRTLGGGRYSHWGRELYFSTSDNSDPRTNGRRYFVLEENEPV